MPFRNPFERLSFGDVFRPKRRKDFLTPGITEQPQGSVVEAGDPSEEGRDWSGYLRDLQDVYMAEGPAMSAYREHVRNLPTYTPPGKAGRIVAALAGAAEGWRGGAASGLQTAQGVLQTPYRQQLEQWGLKEQALGREAGLEEDLTGRKIQFMREARGISKDESEYRRHMANLEFEQQKHLDLQKWRDQQTENARRSGLEVMTDEEGGLWQFDPLNPEQKTFLGRGPKATEFANEAERIRIARQNAATSARQADYSGGQLDVARERESRLATTPRTTDVISPTQQVAARGEAMRRAVEENPDWAGYVKDGEINQRVARKYSQGFKDFQRRLIELEEEILNRRRTPIIE